MKHLVLFIMSLVCIAIFINADQISLSNNIKINETHCFKYRDIKVKVDVIDSYDIKNGSSPIYKQEERTKRICIDSGKALKTDSKIIRPKELKVGVGEKDGIITIDDTYDGNGDGICQKGETCCTIIDDVMSCSEYNADRVSKRLRGVGI